MKLNPYLAVILAATLGASSGVFIKLLSLPAETITAFRLAVPSAAMLCYLLYSKTPLFRGNWKIMLFASFLNAARLLLYFIAYLYTSISNVVVILFTWPVFATLFGIVLLKEKVSRRTTSLIAMAFLGIMLMYLDTGLSFGNQDFMGIVASLFSALVFALTAVIFKKELENYSKTETIFYQNIAGAVLFAPFLFTGAIPSILHAGVAVIYAFLVGVCAFLLFFYALKRLKISHYSLMAYWEIPAAIFFGVVFFNEQITPNIIVGGALIVASGILLKK